VFAVIAVGALVPASATAQTLIGTPSPDRLVATAPEGALLFGGGGYDDLVGGAGNDTLYGGRSGNRIRASGGNNYAEGGTGDDLITAGDGLNTIYGGSGHDTIRAGNGNNYVDAGGAPDHVELGDGDNVLHTGSGGGTFSVGNGSNTIYAGGGPMTLTAGTGVNRITVMSVAALQRVDCGGNPASVLIVNTSGGADQAAIDRAVASRKIVHCSTVASLDGPGVITAQTTGLWNRFKLIGDEGRDKLFGGHGGGFIDGKGGDNIIWADQNQLTGGKRARSKTTTIVASGGNNQIFGGRGTNQITLGSGNNFIRAGAWNNAITTGGGDNNVRLQGRGRNTITFNGGANYVESFTRASRPRIRCENGATAIIVHGMVRPRTNCGKVTNASTTAGKRLQLEGIERIVDSDPVVDQPALPGANGIGVPRPLPIL
jgi:Ca2+-binding RTX toxin-like protein